LTITHVTRNGESEREEMRMDIAPVTPTIGAEVSGLDLSREIEPAIADRIYDAVINHLVLFFRNQNLSPQAQFEFSRTFGSPARPHPVYPHLPGFDRVVLLENDGDRPPDTDDWHSDLTFQPNPPFLSVLYAEHIPPCGGDTLWANMYAAYENLPAEVQALVSRLSAVHDMGAFRNDYLGEDNDVEALNTGLASVGSAVHPIAPKHPVTGRRLLFVNRSFTQHIVGMLKSESDRLLQYLFSHLENPSYQVRFRWQKGSVAIWDNRSTQHYAVADYLPDYRRMHRVIIDTDKRVAASD
jgi:taurine dioxygenase